MQSDHSEVCKEVAAELGCVPLGRAGGGGGTRPLSKQRSSAGAAPTVRCFGQGHGSTEPPCPAAAAPPKPNASLPLRGLPSLDSWKTRVADNTRRGFRQWVTPLARSKSRAGRARCWVCPQEVLGACCCPSVRLSVHLHGPKTGQGQAEHCAPLLGCAGTGALSFGWPREIVHYHTQTNTPVTLLLNTAKHGSNGNTYGSGAASNHGGKEMHRRGGGGSLKPVMGGRRWALRHVDVSIYKTPRGAPSAVP